MECTEFRCLNCGHRVERNIMPTKSAVLGSLPSINKHVKCCEQPDYEDLHGYRRKLQQPSIRSVIPGLRA